MKIEVKGYTPEYKDGFLECLKNNYSWMAEESNDALYEWTKPFMEYDWKERLPEEVRPYQHGMIFYQMIKLLDFLGLSILNAIGMGTNIFTRTELPGPSMKAIVFTFSKH